MIQLQAISRSFGPNRVLDQIDLDIPEGSFTSLLGPSGCGKSTLLRILAGLDQPDSGAILFDSVDMRYRSATDRNIAMVFQSYALYPHMDVRSNIALPLAMRNMSRFERLPVLTRLLGSARRKRAANMAQVANIAAMLGLTSLLDRKPSQLSGGQKQRVAVGRALVRDPVAFLLDEPLSNLDTKLRGEMREEISHLHKETGKTFIYVTHDQTEAMSLSDQVAVMMGGRILQVAPPRVLYAKPACLAVASFVGEHPINLVSLAPEKSPAKLGNISSLPAPFSAFCLQAPVNEPFILGLRPENLSLCDEGPLSGKVCRIDYLGGRSLIDVALEDGTILRAAQQLGAHIPQNKDPVALNIDPENIYLFSTETGLRLNAPLSLSFSAMEENKGAGA